MPAMTNYLENKLIDQLFRGQAYTFPTTLHFALMTATPTDASSGTEVSGGGYLRVGIAASLTNFSGTQAINSTSVSAGVTGTTYNTVAIIFPAPTANWGVLVAMGIYDAATGGNLLWWGPLSASKTVNNGDSSPSFAANSFSLRLDD